jgi:hypothetical protein
VAAAARRRVGEALRLVALRLVLRLAAPFRAALFRAAPLRALVFRDALARERVERFALRAAADFRPRGALFLRLPLLFFLPRGGITPPSRARLATNRYHVSLITDTLKLLFAEAVYTRSSVAR